MRLHHVSETPGIGLFEPRVGADGVAKVWAIEARTLCNYLLPRDCPRVCFRPSEAATPEELALLEGAAAIVAIEAGWLGRVQAATLHLYDMPAAGFTLEDRIAGYWTSREAVVPISATSIGDLPTRIAAAEARLVVLPTLWPLHDRIRATALDFSLIRMRNALPRG